MDSLTTRIMLFSSSCYLNRRRRRPTVSAARERFGVEEEGYKVEIGLVDDSTKAIQVVLEAVRCGHVQPRITGHVVDEKAGAYDCKRNQWGCVNAIM